MDKKELLQKFYKNSGRTPDFNWDNLLEKKYYELYNGNDEIQEAIIKYCLWNRKVGSVSDKDYDYFKNILQKNELL